jgi:hypothetical protein
MTCRHKGDRIIDTEAIGHGGRRCAVSRPACEAYRPSFNNSCTLNGFPRRLALSPKAPSLARVTRRIAATVANAVHLSAVHWTVLTHPRVEDPRRGR